MKRILRVSAVLTCALAGGLTTTGCGTSVTGPGDPSEVTLEVRVTGGVAGVDYRLRVDGRDRRVFLDCTSGCPAGEGPILALGRAQWDDLVGDVVASGIPTIGDRDYGVTCCDFFTVEILYRDGGLRSRVQGDDGTFPRAMAALAERLLDLGGGRIPALVRPGSAPADFPTDAASLDSLRVDGRYLMVGVTYGGGCALHEFDLVFGGEWLESFPVQTRGWLTHEDNDDFCDALPSEVRHFDLTPLFEAYRALYPGSGGEEPLMIRIAPPGGGAERSIEVIVP